MQSRLRFTIWFVLVLIFTAGLTLGQRFRSSEHDNQSDRSTQDEDRARDLYYAAGSDSAPKNIGLRIKVYQQMTGECDFQQVSSSKTFRSGDQLRLGVESNTTGHLYIFQRGSSGSVTRLFPLPELNGGDNQIKRGNELVVPGRSWFTFDNTAGVENLIFIVTRKPTEIAAYLVPSQNSKPSAPRAGSVESHVIDVLQGHDSRDLVYSAGSGHSSHKPVGGNSVAIYDSVYAVNANSTINNYCIVQVRLNHN